MRQIVLDTETTGLEPEDGHRIIEIGCVEVVNRRKTDVVFHRYLNPERHVEEGAFDVHGLSSEFLSDKPRFADIAQDLIDFIRESELVIHNAPFDIAFLDAELSRLGSRWGKIDNYCRIFDTLDLARELHPGQKNSLDALCARYEVDNSQRELHGALLDAQILLDVYLGMTGGQTNLSLEDDESAKHSGSEAGFRLAENRPALCMIQPGADELAAHQARIRAIEDETGKPSLWSVMEQGL